MAKKPIKATGTPATDQRYHNIKRLLKDYRTFRLTLKMSAEQHMENFESEYEMDIGTYLDTVYQAGAEINGTKLEAHARTLKRTQLILDAVDRAVNIIREGHPNGEVYYWILYYAYLCPKKIDSVEEIRNAVVKKVGVKACKSRDVYFAKMNDAQQVLKQVLWGIEMTPEMSTVLEAHVQAEAVSS
ncbi:MAG: hypothetical protein FWE11_10955 [Defluviitaleaceae bacterium]|nr:hypothetical protein [Defluviitaleaceae bacterium]